MKYKPHTANSLKYIYKYRSLAGESFDHVKSILTQHKLYFVNPLKLNDPFDCKPKYILSGSEKQKMDHFSNILKDREPELTRSGRRKKVKSALKNLKQTNIENFFKKALTKTLEQVGICSFSEVYDDILMWSHYADSHRGICLRFKASSYTPFFNEAQQVEYQVDYPCIDILNDDDNKKLLKILFTKSKHWEYEYEWRITNYKEGAGEHIFPAELLDGVILGANISNADRKQVMSWRNKYEHDIKIYQAKLKDAEYGIELESIS